MNTTDTFRPILVFELKEKYVLFIKYLFGMDEHGNVVINLDHPVGKLINSMWIISDRPVNIQHKHPVSVSLPVTATSHYKVRYSNIHIPKWKQEQLQQAIAFYYEITMREFFVIGYEKNYGRDKIIDAVLRELNQDKYFFTFDMIAKFDYRNRVKICENMRFEINRNRKQLKVRE
jgi:hypothetical protein